MKVILHTPGGEVDVFDLNPGGKALTLANGNDLVFLKVTALEEDEVEIRVLSTEPDDELDYARGLEKNDDE